MPPATTANVFLKGIGKAIEAGSSTTTAGTTIVTAIIAIATATSLTRLGPACNPLAGEHRRTGEKPLIARPLVREIIHEIEGAIL